MPIEDWTDDNADFREPMVYSESDESEKPDTDDGKYILIKRNQINIQEM